MKRPLEKRDIAERLGEFGRRRVALDAAAVPRQHDEGEIRPGLLRRDPFQQRTTIGSARGFLGDDRNLGAAQDLLRQIEEIGADMRLQVRVAQNVLCDRRVAPARGKDECPFGGLHIHGGLSRINGDDEPT